MEPRNRDELIRELARRVTSGVVERVRGKVRLELGQAPQNSWLLDLERPESVSLTQVDAPGQCTFRIRNPDDLASMFQGTLTPTAALLEGKLEVDGDLAVAMRAERALFG